MTMLDDDIAPARKWHSGFGGFLLRDWPYLLMLLLSLGGVAYTSFTQTELYWVLLTPLFGLVCVITGWPQVDGRNERVQLVVTQALHWVAVLVAMQLMSLQVLRQVTGIAGPLSVLTLLALGTFTAGLHIRSWKVCVVGAILALGVPAVALLQQSALLILLIVAVLVAIAVPFFWARSRDPVGPAHPLYEEPAPAAYEPPAAPVSQTPLFDPPVEPMTPTAVAEAPVPDEFDPGREPITMGTGTEKDIRVGEPEAIEPAGPVVPGDGGPEARDPAKSEPKDGEERPGNVRNIFGSR